MNILKFYKELINKYNTYIQSFLNIKDPEILTFVKEEIRNKKLWPEPLVQFNPTFESSRPIGDLCDEGILHEEFKKIFSGLNNLYRHQEEAIRIGVSGKEFVVTSGTGSGKSLTYLATIFNHILHQGDIATHKIQAVIVYPMNALINSQFKEIEKFKNNYEEKYSKPFPITFDQYTGQETEEQKEKLKENPPHILLTNYMMLELVMTRSGRDKAIRENFLKNIKYLVFDELHTYRGRQGSDVAILIRRIRSAASHRITCIGTSATMVSDDTSTLWEQKKKVAQVASTIFGSDIQPDQVVNEYLVRSLEPGYSPSKEDLKNAIKSEISVTSKAQEFEKHPTANWIEEQIALESKEGVWVRRKPIELSKIAQQLAEYTDTTQQDALLHLEQLLEWANVLNTSPENQKKYLPFRIHQFIAQTGSVYATLGNQESRKLFLDAGLYADSEETRLFPLVFSRISGHEFYCVKLNKKESIILPREFYDVDDDDDDNLHTEEGYLFIQHNEDQEPIWDEDRDISNLPETWFYPPRKNGTQKLKKERQHRLPRKIWFNKSGAYSFTDRLDFEGWFMPAPLMFDPTSGTIYDSQTAEWTKLVKLGGEGRSSATTVLAFETIALLRKYGQAAEKQKLLSFTDNRQDASLQAGHFNDFVRVGQLRAAIVKALDKYDKLDFTKIADKVFECLNIGQDQFAKHPATFPGPKKENEDVFKDFIMYRLLQDLRRSWRVVLPNLEQCALLKINYKYLEENTIDDAHWQQNELLAVMSPDQRMQFLYQVLDFFRKSYAISYSMLESGTIVANQKMFKEKLKAPWTLDENEKLEKPNHIRLEIISSSESHMYFESAGYKSVFGRYLKNKASEHGIKIQGKDAYNNFTYKLFDLLTDAGWLVKRKVKNDDSKDAYIYQLKIENILWCKGDGKNIIPDEIRYPTYKTHRSGPNTYFQQFYKINFQEIKPIEGREHTGQINSEERKRREEKFRSGEISALFCSPTMELGIDISDLSVVHMRNVPPSPANYAQRSGRAGRSGQAALVMVYCSNFSPHDRHYFKHANQMVAGSVSAPRLDLINEELLRSHLNASILTLKPLSALNNSLGDLVDLNQLERLPLKQEIIDTLKISEEDKTLILNNYKKILEDSYFKSELAKRKPTWFTDDWIKQNIDSFQQSFDRSLDRWRKLYKAAQNQINAATSIIQNRVYANNHEKKNEAHKSLRQAERQRDLLLNDPSDAATVSKDQSEFYPYRYLAAEGFLPGYNFTRLPIRSFMESLEGSGEFISRPRFIALSEFGPRNVIYHDGTKYRVDRMILTEAELRLEKGKICPKTGYFLYDKQYGYEVDPIIDERLELDTNRHVHTTLLEMTETRAYELQRITCQEEERAKKGFDIQTYFAVDGGMENTFKAIVRVGNEKLLNIHYLPTCRIFKLNLKWRASPEDGFTIHLNTGYWQSKQQKEEKLVSGEGDQIKNVKLFTSGTANALYLQPIKALGLEGGKKGVITLMFAIKRAIENYFQVESNEIGASIMGDDEAPNILIYEAAEGSLGVLSQIIDDPSTYKAIMEEAYKVCFFKNGVEEEGKVLPATYDDLLSYYNQMYHHQIDRNLIRSALRNLKASALEIISNPSFASYDEQYHSLLKSIDLNSSTESRFIEYLYKRGLKLPDEAQPVVNDMFVRPDFFYKPNVFIFCDGTPHDHPDVKRDDMAKRAALKNAGYQVLSWYYKDSLDEFIAKRPDIFKKVLEK